MVTRMHWEEYQGMQVCFATPSVVFCFREHSMKQQVSCLSDTHTVHSLEHEPGVLFAAMSKQVPSHCRSV